MKENLLIILFITIFLSGGCQKNEPIEDYQPKNIDSSVLTKLNDTKKIVITKKTDDDKKEIMGTITKEETIKNVLTDLQNTEMQEDCNLITTKWSFTFYNENEEVIDEYLVWVNRNDGVIPIDSKAPCLYNLPDNNGLKKIIEESTNYKFFTVSDETKECQGNLELVGKDNNYAYYYSCEKSSNVYIEFLTTNEKMLVKDALKKKKITITELASRYPNLFIPMPK